MHELRLISVAEDWAGIFLGLVSLCPRATLYAGDGDPEAESVLIRWIIDCTRFNPEAEANQLGLVNGAPGGSPDYDVAEDSDGINDFGSTPAHWVVWSG